MQETTDIEEVGPDDGIKSVKQVATNLLTNQPALVPICEGGGCSSEPKVKPALSNKMPAIIISHGSFNPVHRHHLMMMETAKHCLEENGFEVKYGVMAITAQEKLYH